MPRKDKIRISTHAPREGCDPWTLPRAQACWIFQPTHPVRGATGNGTPPPPGELISIHAPREGCDKGHSFGIQTALNFNPRTPHGVRHEYLHKRAIGDAISTHAPREGCDPQTLRRWCMGGGFQSTHPVRGATDPASTSTPSRTISIHAPREGCDNGVRGIAKNGAEFQSTHPSRGATVVIFSISGDVVNFNPRTPHGVRLDKVTELWTYIKISIHAPLTGCD